MRDCANCFHRKPVLKEDGTWTAECEKWDCEFQSRENMIEKTKAMNNDSISREYMKKAIEQFFVREKYYHPHSKGRKTIPTEEVLDLIDNAPTVEPQKVPIANVTFDTEKLKELTDEIVERIKRGEIVLQDERPKGEWIIVDDTTCECPFCKNIQVYVLSPKESNVNFCENCGADMRGEES